MIFNEIKKNRTDKFILFTLFRPKMIFLLITYLDLVLRCRSNHIKVGNNNLNISAGMGRQRIIKITANAAIALRLRLTEDKSSKGPA